MSLLILENIVKEYKNKTILNGASLSVNSGERVALVGPNGSGKSTLLKIAMGLEPADSGRITVARQTKVGYLSQDLMELEQEGVFNKTALDYEKVSRLEQELRQLEMQMSDPAYKCDEKATEQLLGKYSRLTAAYESMEGYTVESKLKATLLGLGLRKEALILPLGMLSGGEKMRVALARILLENPDLLILDEPTNHLDIQATEWLENFLCNFAGGVLVVSHDRYFLDRVASRVAELDGGTIAVRSGNYSTFMEEKRKRFEFVVKEQKRLETEIAREERIALQMKSMRNISAYHSRLKVSERLRTELTDKLGSVRQKEHLRKQIGPKIAFARTDHISAEIAKANGLSKFYGELGLFSNVSFLIRGGERVGIVGPNGCGKTTLLNILMGLDTEYQGVAGLGSWVRYGYIGQKITFADESRTIMEELLSKKELKDAEACDHLSRFQFYGDDTAKRIEVLSGGEKVRLLLACIMLDEPNCLVLDEPTNHLDVPARDALESAILEFKGTIIAVSHDRYFLNRCINRIFEMEDGRINVYQGNYDFYRNIKSGRRGSETEQGLNAAASMQHGKLDSTINREKREKGMNKTTGIDAGEKGEKHLQPSEVEARIALLEDKLKEMEASFGCDTPFETYREYDAIAGEVNKLYETWESLLEVHS